MKANDIMSKKIITAETEESVLSVSKKMKINNIGFIPILDNDDVVGVVTDRDIVINSLANNSKPTDKIKNYMTKDVISIESDSNLNEVIKKMKTNKIKRIIVSENGKMVGIISISDFINSNLEENEVLESIKHIWDLSDNKKEENPDVDDFYL